MGKYDYSLLRIDYINSIPTFRDKIRIICNEHGVFTLKYGKHKQGSSCLECRGIKKPGYWNNRNLCIGDARKYSDRRTWMRSSSGAYNAAKRNGWIDVCTQHMVVLKNPKGFITIDVCKKDAKKYKTRSEWALNSRSIYNTARRHKWVENCTSHMKIVKRPNGYWTLQRCIEDAKTYNTKVEWRASLSGAYGAAKSHGWIEKCTSHMEVIKKPNGYWTLEKCLKESKKYKTRSEWHKSSSSSFIYAWRLGILSECTEHMTNGRQTPKYWTLIRCKVDAKKYKSRGEWQMKSNGYRAAHKKGWLNLCCKHMKPLSR